MEKNSTLKIDPSSAVVIKDNQFPNSSLLNLLHVHEIEIITGLNLKVEKWPLFYVEICCKSFRY